MTIKAILMILKKKFFLFSKNKFFYACVGKQHNVKFCQENKHIKII